MNRGKTKSSKRNIRCFPVWFTILWTNEGEKYLIGWCSRCSECPQVPVSDVSPHEKKVVRPLSSASLSNSFAAKVSVVVYAVVLHLFVVTVWGINWSRRTGNALWTISFYKRACFTATIIHCDLFLLLIKCLSDSCVQSCRFRNAVHQLDCFVYFRDAGPETWHVCSPNQ